MMLQILSVGPGLSAVSITCSDGTRSILDVPVNCYFASLLGTESDWNYQTVPQPHAGDDGLTWPRGKVLGGSSAINGLYLVRPSQIEVDT